MPATDYRVRVTLPYATGLATDVAVNDFSFHDNLGTADLGALMQNVADFYNEENAHTGHNQPVAYYISNSIDRGADRCKIDVYDRAILGAPVASATFTLGNSADAAVLPTEAAAALSFNAVLTGVLGDLVRRRKGRVFIGPLNPTVGILDSNGLLYLRGEFINDTIWAAAEFLGAANLIDGFRWDVWSTVDGVGRLVVTASMDNAFDTMRSRGPAPTGRNFVAV